MYILTTLEFPKHNFDYHLLTTSLNAKYYSNVAVVGLSHASRVFLRVLRFSSLRKINLLKENNGVYFIDTKFNLEKANAVKTVPLVHDHEKIWLK